MPNGKKKKGHKMATHKRKKRLRKIRHKSTYTFIAYFAPSQFVTEGVCQLLSVDMPLFCKY